MTSLVDPVYNTTSFAYDRLGRLAWEWDELGMFRFTGYDEAGNVESIVDARGLLRTFEYDALNRRTAEKWHDGQDIVRTFSYDYDAAGQLASAGDGIVDLGFGYDMLGRATTIDYDVDELAAVGLTQGFDNLGRRTSLKAKISATDDFINTYQYDALSRMTEVVQEEQSGGNAVTWKKAAFEYNDVGQFDTITRYRMNGQTETADVVSQFDYESAGRVSALSHKHGTTPVAGYAWTYDSLGRVTAIDFTPSANDAEDGTFSYDATSQLIKADRGGTATTYDEAYAYDLNGNRAVATTGTASKTYQIGAGNRVLFDGVYYYDYDGDGNRAKRYKWTDADEQFDRDLSEETVVTEYTWDHRSRLTKVVTRSTGDDTATTKTIDYVYDAFDRVIAKTLDPDGDGSSPAVSSWFIYDGPNLALQLDGAGGVTHRYLHGPAVDQILADEDVAGEVTYWTLADNQGSVRDLVELGDAGAVVQHVKYNAFGRILNAAPFTPLTIFLYTGRVWDIDVGIYNYRDRWYDPVIGSFISKDPLGLGPDTDPYRYVCNTPVNATDPSGLDFIPDWTHAGFTPNDIYWVAQYNTNSGTLWSQTLSDIGLNDRKYNFTLIGQYDSTTGNVRLDPAKFTGFPRLVVPLSELKRAAASGDSARVPKGDANDDGTDAVWARVLGRIKDACEGEYHSKTPFRDAVAGAIDSFLGDFAPIAAPAGMAAQGNSSVYAGLWEACAGTITYVGRCAQRPTS